MPRRSWWRARKPALFFGKAVEDFAANRHILATVTGSTGFHRVLPIKNIEAPIPVADLRLVRDVLREVFRDLRNLLHPQHTLIFNTRDQQCTVYHPIGKLAFRQSVQVQIGIHHNFSSFMVFR